MRTQAFDARLMRNLPLDLRTVLGWDADNTDIDLWVVDPHGERAFYGHPLTQQGGRMSQDDGHAAADRAEGRGDGGPIRDRQVTPGHTMPSASSTPET